MRVPYEAMKQTFSIDPHILREAVPNRIQGNQTVAKKASHQFFGPTEYAQYVPT